MKSPAFQFYPADFLLGTMGMTDEEIGVYIKMLAFQWDRGGLPNCPKTIRKTINSCKKPSENVLQKFTLGDDGFLRNDRLEKEREKQLTFRQSRADNAKRGWEKRSTSNARADSSTCIDDALQSSSSSSSSDGTPLPPKGDDGLGLEIESNEYLPKGWRKLPDRQQRRRKVNGNSALMIRLGRLFDRRPTTLWTIAEAGTLEDISPDQDEVDLICEFYEAGIDPEKDHRRHGLQTMINNWNGELDKARLWKNSL